jgi:hypothetical protein
VNLEWLKKHKGAAIGGGLALLLIVYLLFRNSSSSSGGLGSAIAQQNAGQEQMAELNAQESAQTEQTQAQLAAQEYETQAGEQEEQDQTVGSLAAQLIPEQLAANLQGEELTAQESEEENLLPLEENALSISTQGNRATTGQNELALLLGEGGDLQAGNPQIPTGISISTPWGGLGLSGLFG